MRSRFSRPTPCSPVSTPPTSTHSFRISKPNASALVELAGHIRVVEDQRMQVAVAGVENIRDAQARSAAASRPSRAARAAARGAESCRPCSSSRGSSGRRPETPTCARPRTRAARARSSETRMPRARVARGDRAHALDEVVDLDCRAVELDDQQRLHVERIADAARTLRRRESPACPSSPCRPE